MPVYRKIPMEVIANRWPDEPDSDIQMLFDIEKAHYGKESICSTCGYDYIKHGFINTGHIVCVGDYIIQEADSKKYPVKPEIFNKNYEYVKDSE